MPLPWKSCRNSIFLFLCTSTMIHPKIHFPRHHCDETYNLLNRNRCNLVELFKIAQYHSFVPQSLEDFILSNGSAESHSSLTMIFMDVASLAAERRIYYHYFELAYPRVLRLISYLVSEASNPILAPIIGSMVEQ